MESKLYKYYLIKYEYLLNISKYEDTVSRFVLSIRNIMEIL